MIMPINSTGIKPVTDRGMSGVAWLYNEPSPPATTLRQRSRGKHDPGSGPYLNRIVSGGYTAVKVNGNVYCTSIDVIDQYTQPFAYPEGGYYGVFWDQHIYATATAGNRNVSNPSWRLESVRVYYKAKSKGWHSVNFEKVLPSGANITCVSRGFPNTKAGAYALLRSFLDDPSWVVLGARAGYADAQELSGPYTTVVREPRFEPRLDFITDEIDLDVPHSLGFDAGFAAAYIDAISNVPTAFGMGNAVNIIQLATALVKILGGIISGAGLSIDSIGSLKDAWLGYRYEYSTTKADIEEAVSIASRIASLRVDNIRCNGVAKRGNWTFRCSVHVNLANFTALQSSCERIGAQLDGYAIWDMVPFSFIIDWFIDIGGWLEHGRWAEMAHRLGPQTCWFSARCEFTNSFGFHELYYHRFLGISNPSLAALSYINRPPSGVTIVKRGLDLLALLG